MSTDALDATLAEPALLCAARAALSPDGSIGPAAIQRLRATWPAELVTEAVTQAQLRRRGEAKFGERAHQMAFTADGLEQASQPAVAALRAGRFAQHFTGLAGGAMADLCCGIGADLTALDAALPAGVSLVGVDRDPRTAVCARHNSAVPGGHSRVRIDCADVAAVDLASVDAAFIDPARRAAGRRTFDLESYSPPFSFVQALADAVPATAAKLAPGIAHDAIPEGVEAQWVSWRGALKEATLWFGPLRTARHRATVLPGGETLTDADLPDGAALGGGADVGPIGAVLYEPDPAVIRAGLVAAVAAQLPGGRLLDPHIAYVTADAPIPTPFASGFAVFEVLRYSERTLRAALQSHSIGRAEIKVRGLDIDPAVLRPRLKLRGDAACTVLMARLDSGPIAVLAHRL